MSAILIHSQSVPMNWVLLFIFCFREIENIFSRKAEICVLLALLYRISKAGLVIFVTLKKLLWVIHYSVSNPQDLFILLDQDHTRPV